MSDVYERELERLHSELAGIYRRGALLPTEQHMVEGLWARIERLEAEYVKDVARRERASYGG